MRLHTLVLKDISRRKTKLGLAVLSVVVAAAAIVAVITTFSAATQGLYEESNKFGANIIVKPEVKTIPLVAGSTSIGSLSTGENYIEESEISKIHTIKNNANLAVVAPRLYGIAKLGNSSVVVMGVDPDKEKKLKSWWNIQGHWMAAGTSDPNKTEGNCGLGYSRSSRNKRRIANNTQPGKCFHQRSSYWCNRAHRWQ